MWKMWTQCWQGSVQCKISVDSPEPPFRIQQLSWLTTSSFWCAQKIVGFFKGLVQCKLSVNSTEPPFPNPATVLVDHIIILVCPKNCLIFLKARFSAKSLWIPQNPISKSNNCPGLPHQHWLVCLENCWTFLRAWINAKSLWNPQNPHFQI